MRDEHGRLAGLGSVVAAFVAICAGGAFAWGSDEFCLDDAYIHLAYARSLRLGDGFSYNPGDWELGSSSPLWAIVLSIVPEGARTVAIVKGLGIALHGVGAALAGTLALQLAERNAASRAAAFVGALAAGLLVALHPLLLQAASSGMEVPLAILLLAGTALALLGDKRWLAAALALLSVWARPESLVFVVVLSLVVALMSRSRDALYAALGAMLGMLAWATYCLVLSGYPLPNTFYAKKGAIDLVRGVDFLVTRVAPLEVWLVGVGGLVLLGLALRDDMRARRAGALALLGAWFTTLIAISLGRQLNSNITFFFERYFAIVAFAPAALLGAVITRRGARAALFLAPSALVLSMAIPEVHARARLQEHNIRTLHTDVARWVSRELPSDARVLVEGAGALRYFTPRSMRVIDAIGLNYGRVVHSKSLLAYACAWSLSNPQYLAIPSEMVGTAAAIFRGEVLKTFREPRYAMSLSVRAREVVVVRVTSVDAKVAARCKGLAP